MEYAETAKTYAREVLSGKIPAGELARCACRRFLDDLSKAAAPDYPFRFDSAAGNRVCAFAELMTHVKGEWAHGTLAERRIRLQPFQCFILVNLFGWLKKSDGKRRFNEAYIEIPRKNGKSILAGIIGLYMLAADREPGAEVYCAATSLTQAKEVFNPAREMADADPQFKAYYGLACYKSRIECGLNNGTFERIVAKPKDGASPHCAILDELHEHPGDALFESQKKGMGARSQPLLLSITTAGSNYYSFCKEKHDEAANVLTEVIPNEKLFCVIYGIDKGDQPFTRRSLRKANPNLGVSVREEYLLDAMEMAKAYPNRQNNFLTKYLNVWTMADAAFFNMVKWRDMADRSLAPEECKGLPCYLGVDLASKLDLCAIALVFVDFKGRERHYYVFARAYIPGKQTEEGEPNAGIYRKLALEGSLTVHPGAETNHTEVLEDLIALVGEYKPVFTCFDPYQAAFIIQALQERHRSAKVMEVGQTVKNLSPAMREVEAALESGRIHHSGDSALAWCVANVCAREDRNANVYPVRKNANAKIDCAMAMLDAMTQAMRHTGSRRTPVKYRVHKL